VFQPKDEAGIEKEPCQRSLDPHLETTFVAAFLIETQQRFHRRIPVCDRLPEGSCRQVPDNLPCAVVSAFSFAG
jgi:hypothetical protein